MAENYDVLVVGGGMAGCAAALAAVREGARTLLIEQHGYLGGNATRAMVSPWQSYHAAVHQADGSLPAQVIGGIAQEFVDDLIAVDASPGHIVDPIGFAGSITPVDSEQLKLYLPDKLTNAGLEIRLSTPLSPELLDGAAQIVDASGTVAASRMLGAPVIEPTEPQPMSWLFTMVNVNTAAIRNYQLAHRAEFVLHPAVEQLRADYVAVSGFFTLLAQAREREELSIPRDRLLCFSTPRPGEVLVNATRIPPDHPAPEAEGKRQIRELAEWLPRRVPGFADAQLGRIADSIGERESYRLAGRDRLSVSDIVEGRTSPEAIARGCYPVDIHRANSAELESRGVGGPGWYDIPLGCLEAAGFPRLLCAGRCLSADREGFASARVLPTAMATGHAAGYIAAQRALGKDFGYLTCLSKVSLV